MLILEIKSLNRVKCDTLLETGLLVSYSFVFEALECVEVAAILADQGAWVATLHIKRWHDNPFLVVNIKLLAIFNHEAFSVATADNVNEAVAEVIVSRERRSPVRNVWHSLNCARS